MVRAGGGAVCRVHLGDNANMSDVVEVKVTARAGRRIAGFGSRQQGESFMLPVAVAEYALTLDGFEAVRTARKSKPKSEAKPLAEPEPEVAEKDNDNAL